LQIVPLPREGRPADFSGAIGSFTIASDASPAKAQPGDPITLKVTVSGQGNFDAVNAPTLTNDDGWRSYPPSQNFQATDSLGYSGDKEFNFTMVAKQDQKATPGISFAYFDPAKDKYLTITSSPVAVDAKGSAPAPSQPLTAAAQTPAQASSATPGPAVRPAVAELSGDFTPRKFQPLIVRTSYLASSGVALCAWLAFLGFLMVRNYNASDAAHQATLAKDRRRLLDRLAPANVETSEFYRTVIEFIASRLGLPSSDTDAMVEKISSSRMPDALKLKVVGLFDRHAELHYSARGGKPLGSEERQRVIETLKEFDKAL
jgi:hypothetical protein